MRKAKRDKLLQRQVVPEVPPAKDAVVIGIDGKRYAPTKCIPNYANLMRGQCLI
jgi:hypothetical protein